MSTANFELVFGNGQVTERFNTLEDVKSRILSEWPDAIIGGEWEPTAPGYEGLNVQVGDLEDVDSHEIRREIQ